MLHATVVAVPKSIYQTNPVEALYIYPILIFPIDKFHSVVCVGFSSFVSSKQMIPALLFLQSSATILPLPRPPKPLMF